MITKSTKLNVMNYVEIRELVLREIDRLKTQTAVANKCDVSPASISLIVNENWNGVKDPIWRKVGAALGWRNDNWQVVETNDVRLLFQTFDDAKQWRWWTAVSAPAGSQKTTAAKAYANQNAGNHVYYLECERWYRGSFVPKLAQSLGIAQSYRDSNDKLLAQIIEYFQKIADKRPILILDQFDKLHHNAIGDLLPLFNGCEGKMALVVMGVGHLRKIFKQNVQRQNIFWDELESRFARTYITTYGVTQKEVGQIARANGLNDTNAIKKVWNECNPQVATFQGTNFKVVKDMRLLKRRIEIELHKLELAAPERKATPQQKQEPAMAN